MKAWEKTAIILAGIGALNWGLVALGFDLVKWILDLIPISWLGFVVYVAVGASGGKVIYDAFKKK